jgi:hypothetical protein
MKNAAVFDHSESLHARDHSRAAGSTLGYSILQPSPRASAMRIRKRVLAKMERAIGADKVLTNNRPVVKISSG